MSQSDYIKYKRVSNVLNNDNNLTQNKFPPVLSSQNYTEFSQFTLLNNIINTTPKLNELITPGVMSIFEINKRTINCPTGNFITCKYTNERPNRNTNLPGHIQDLSHVYVTPQPKTIKDTKNASNQKSWCSCKIDNSIKINKKICKCKLGAWGIVR